MTKTNHHQRQLRPAATHCRQVLLVSLQLLLFTSTIITTTNGYVLSPPTLTIMDRIKALSPHAKTRFNPKQQQQQEQLKQKSDAATTLDTTQIGSLTVPSVGVGTISWSSSSCKWLMIVKPACLHAFVLMMLFVSLVCVCV
jgi:hypothetical protein